MLGRTLTALYAVPEFVLALAQIALLAYGAGLFPVGGMNDPVTSLLGSASEKFADAARHLLLLPALTLALGWGAGVVRQQRAAIAVRAGDDFFAPRAPRVAVNGTRCSRTRCLQRLHL